MTSRTAIVLFRNDLRLSDNPALVHACKVCDAIIPVFVWDPEALAPWAPGAAARFWLRQSLDQLAASLRKVKSCLVLRQGDAVKAVLDIASSTGATCVYWNRRYEPQAVAADTALKTALRAQGIETASFNASLLVEPWDVTTKAGSSFRVFTPFWKACQREVDIKRPLEAPTRIPLPGTWPDSVSVESLKLDPRHHWTRGIANSWKFGEQGAHAMLDDFLSESLVHYQEGRDRMGSAGSSRLSPYLSTGELSPRQIGYALQQASATEPAVQKGAEAVLRQVFWREFSYHLLYHEPATTNTPLRPAFAHFPWRNDPDSLQRWQQGKTGYPLVDAGMRELWSTGYMHNRARMVVASFLVKHLLIHWHEGARWFWDTLVDADLANNTFGWQWAAGCGADAAPYFRVFNPTRQGERFDPEGAYVRRWAPELSQLPPKYIHRPWEAPGAVLREAGVDLGSTYPMPMVDHVQAREDALAAYNAIRGL